MQSKSKFADFELLTNCPHLAIGFSTFALTAALLNSNRRRLYMPMFPEIMPSFQDGVGYIPLPAECSDSEVHIRTKVGSWVTMSNAKDGAATCQSDSSHGVKEI